MLKQKKRRVPVGRRNKEEYPRLGFEQALDLAINAKRAEVLRERTLKDYDKHFHYFYRWIQPNQRNFVGFRDYVAIDVMLDSGLRIQELLSLRTMDIDFQARFITIPAKKSKNLKTKGADASLPHQGQLDKI